jgi:hypothetical protein
LLHNRLGFDVAVGHHATYYNPLIHIPFYWLAGSVNIRLALFYAGALHGLNILPLYLLARSALVAPANRWLAGALALTGMLGSTVITMIGSTSYDTFVSAPVLGSLAVLVIKRNELCTTSLPAARAAGLAGLLLGLATGLKLVEVFYTVGFAVVLLLLPGSLAVRSARLAAGGAAGLAGVLLFAGFWFLTLQHATGNPLFPFYNSIFRSPLIAPTYFGATSFLPESLGPALSFPFRFLQDYHVADDGPFHDFRVPIIYVLLPLASIWFAVTRRRPAAVPPLVSLPATRILFIFVVGSYVAWLLLFAVYRYLIALEMLAPLLILAALDCVPQPPRLRLAATAIILGIAALLARYNLAAHVPASAPYVIAQGLSFPRPANTLLLMTGTEPMAYLIPLLPPAIPVLRIDGWLADPSDGSGLTASMRARVAAHRGDVFLLSAPQEHAAAERATAAYGFQILATQCHEVSSNLGGPYELCPLNRRAGSDGPT